MSYKSWKNKIQMWQLVTSIDKKEQAIVVLLESLDNNTKAEKTFSEFTATELNSDGGMAKLDSVFQSETIDEAYETYPKFINILRQVNNDMGDYIIEFEHFCKCTRYFGMKLPYPVVTFKLLDGSNISVDE